MAEPVVVSVTKNTITKVATNVTKGNLRILNGEPVSYTQTYRNTGETAPTTSDLEEFALVCNYDTPIDHDVAIDVYLYCMNYDGNVRLDIKDGS